MTTSQHTPGPWHKRSSQLNDFDFSIYADDIDIGCSQRTWIAEVRAAQPILASDANARLIAASPDLLAALEEADAHNPDVAALRQLANAALAGPLFGHQKEAIAQYLQDYARFIRVARAAIAKATGN